jgi:hypothetical protein
MYVRRNIEALSCHHCCSGKAVSITYCECVFVALGIQHKMHVRHIATCGLPGSKMFPHYLRNGTISEGKKSYWTKNACFAFLYNPFSETFLILRRTEQEMIKMHVGLRVKWQLFLSDFNQKWIFSTDVSKNAQISNFMKIRPLGFSCYM